MQRPDHEFHVVDNEITIDFDVPLPSSGADGVLTDLLSHHALEIIKDRKHRGQPLEGIPVARVSATRSGELVEVAVLDLEQPFEFLDIELPELVPLRLTAGYDPLAKFGEKDGKDALPLAARSGGDDLAPIGEEIQLTAGLAAGFRSMGIDPASMTATDLGLGLLRLAGYELQERGDGTYVAIGQGTSTLVTFVNHEPGGYPELSAQAVNSFLIACSSSRTERGLLITDKYGPYLIYRKERASPGIMFVARERLQDFVDTIALS